MKLKLEHLADLSFKEAFSKFISLDLPMETAYKVSNIIDLLQKEEKTFVNLKKKLLDKYGVKDENGNLKINPETQELELTDKPACDQEYKSLLEISFECPPIKLSELKGVKISPIILNTLMGKIITT